jgi:hypothetical protein
MQRHRHDGIGVPQHVVCGTQHQRRQRRGQEAAPAVFERVQDQSERPFIARGAARYRD